jgi:hypothetical protein
MKKYPIFYYVQTDEDKSYNAFVLESEAPTINDSKVREVVQNFPLNTLGDAFHFRFQAQQTEKEQTWVDITNLNARAPVVKGNIFMKVLPLPKSSYSKVFKKIFEGAQTTQSADGNITPKQQVNDSRIPAPNFQPQTAYATNVQLLDGDFTKVSSTFHPGEQRHQGPQNVTNVSFNYTQTKVTTGSANLYDFDVPVNRQNVAPQLDRAALDKIKAAESENKQNLAAQVFVDRMNDEDSKKEEQLKQQEELEPKILNWSHKGKTRKDIRTLLCTLPEILWAESGWEPVDLFKLTTPPQIKKVYKIALLKLHEDKIHTDDPKARYLSRRVISELTDAIKELNAQETKM